MPLDPLCEAFHSPVPMTPQQTPTTGPIIDQDLGCILSRYNDYLHFRSRQSGGCGAWPSQHSALLQALTTNNPPRVSTVVDSASC
ncbi:hypothetical protein PanWU01x14_298270 [Parasponia andersonii]|uniref:Uncharacterized protein n=1 Tax=Parasponia andersonii TaxID=3476 RepID=A0A2P5AUV7_PARAD|nr:hypothetical protein PanWU01x14_298270 [Parasponia andersonii]